MIFRINFSLFVFLFVQVVGVLCAQNKDAGATLNINDIFDSSYDLSEPSVFLRKEDPELKKEENTKNYRFYKKLVDNYWKVKISGNLLSRQGEWEDIFIIFNQTQKTKTKQGSFSIIINSMDPLLKVIINDKEVDAKGMYFILEEISYDLNVGDGIYKVFALTDKGLRIEELQLEYGLSEPDNRYSDGFLEFQYDHKIINSPYLSIPENKNTIQSILKLNVGYKLNFSEEIRNDYYIPDSFLYIFSYHINKENNIQKNEYTFMNHVLSTEKLFKHFLDGELLAGFGIGHREYKGKKKILQSDASRIEEQNNSVSSYYNLFADYQIKFDNSAYTLKYDFMQSTTNYSGDTTENFLFFYNSSGFTHSVTGEYSINWGAGYKFITLISNQTYLTKGPYKRRNISTLLFQISHPIESNLLEYTLEYDHTGYDKKRDFYQLTPTSGNIFLNISYFYLFETSFLKFHAKYSKEDSNIDSKDQSQISLGASYVFQF